MDTQSFPLEIPSYPKLWDGAYSSSERYTVADATEIVRQVISAFYLSYLFSGKTLSLLHRPNSFNVRVADMHKDGESMYWLNLTFQGMHSHGKKKLVYIAFSFKFVMPLTKT